MPQIHQVFTKRLQDWQKLSAKLKKAESSTQTQRVWMAPSDWDGDPFNIPGMHEPSFDRTPINEDYEQVAVDTEQHVGRAGCLKIQLDAVAQMERAFRYRHASGIRCVLHAAARHGGHGNAKGVFGAVANYAQDLLHAGD